MKHNFLSLVSLCMFVFTHYAIAQDCKTTEELDAAPGKFLTAAQYPWPAVRAEYFNKLATPADKATAKQTLAQIEKIEQQSHTGFNLTGGNWENYYSTEGYEYFGNVKLGKYTFQSSLHAFFCAKGKVVRNEEASTILRIYTNQVVLNSMDRFLSYPFGSSFGDYDFGLQYADWKNHKSCDVQAQLISLFTYMSCNNAGLIETINSRNDYFQDVPEKDVRLNNQSNYIYRYWFIKKKNLPVLLPVSRKAYLQSLLEFYEREKLYFPKLITQMTNDHNAAIKRYSNWQADVDDKIAVVQKALSSHDEEWLSAQAVVNRIDDASQSYKAKLFEKTNQNRFWKFYDNEKKGEPLYKYNPEYFKAISQSIAKPQIITIAFRYVTTPASLRLLKNFEKNFDMSALKKMME